MTVLAHCKLRVRRVTPHIPNIMKKYCYHGGLLLDNRSEWLLHAVLKVASQLWKAVKLI
jgi:hypothetical protein